jgi:hypothetical protein
LTHGSQKIKEPDLTYNHGSQQTKRTSSKTYHETVGSLINPNPGPKVLDVEDFHKPRTPCERVYSIFTLGFYEKHEGPLLKVAPTFIEGSI